VSLAARIRERLASLEPLSIDVVDESAKHEGHVGSRPEGETHWRVSVVSRQFAGQSVVARHRMIYQALGDLMQNPIHALAITARAPEETKGSQ
jgi:BolA protein